MLNLTDRENKIMRETLDMLTNEMFAYFSGDPKRIQHFIKVHAIAAYIGRQEKLDPQTQFILESAAFVHDIGIKPAERDHGRCDGKLQEQLGPDEAHPIFEKLRYSADETERICYMIAHHHTYAGIDGTDLQILIEADFIVNLYEDNSSEETILSAYKTIFRTDTGKKLCRTVFGIGGEQGEQ